MKATIVDLRSRMKDVLSSWRGCHCCTGAKKRPASYHSIPIGHVAADPKSPIESVSRPAGLEHQYRVVDVRETCLTYRYQVALMIQGLHVTGSLVHLEG